MNAKTSCATWPTFDFEDVRRSIAGLRSSLGQNADEELQSAFEAGMHPELLSYEKIQASGVSLPILEKYLIGASTYLHQPCNYYDIFRVCRCVYMVQFLNAAIAVLTAKHIDGLEKRLKRLMRETTHDRFDAVAFEIITAARYAEHPENSHTEFLEESNKKTPDFLVRYCKADSFVECKKVDRTQNYTLLVRDSVRDSLNAAISEFRSAGIPLLAEVTFNCDPREVSKRQISDAVWAACDSRTPIIEAAFTVVASPLPKYDSETYKLYPSPDFLWHRYRFRMRSEWFGIVHQLFGSFARLADLPSNLRGGRSSWLNSVDWDAGIRWKISSEEVVAKYRRFAFDGIFNGLNQIHDRGINSCVHLWLETDYYVGNRKITFLDLFNRLVSNEKDIFGWLMINETLFDVSPKGHFDLIEHAHMIRGPKAVGSHAPVTGVFAPDQGSPTAEFGIGGELPDIDD
jgi:hypothetical protein